MATVIEPDGSTREVQPKNGKDFKLDELYEHTKCNCVEVVHLANGRQMIVDEEGLLKGLPLNRTATMMYARSPIVGTVLLIEKRELR